MQIYCEMINLARATERRAWMADELAQAGLSPQIHPAFDHTVEGEEKLQTLCRPEGPWGVFHRANMACTISHLHVWQRFLASPASHCLVLEDDVFIAPDLGQWVDDLGWWPGDADIVKIERWPAKTLKVLMQSHSRHRGRRIDRLLSRHTGAAGYILSRAAAETLCAAAPFDLTIDQLLFNFNASPVTRRMKVYQIEPALVTQGNEPDGAPAQMGARKRPEGMALLRQKLKRLYYELAYPLPTLMRFLSGRAKLHPVTYSATHHLPEEHAHT